MRKMKQSIITIQTLLSIAFCLVSCNATNNASVVESDNEASADDSFNVSSVADGLKSGRRQYDFSISMLEKISSATKDNIVCSPLGIEVLYDILKNGAKGDTYNELDSIIGINSHEGSLIAKDMAFGSEPDGTIVSMANLVVENNSHTLRENYKEKISTDYDADIWIKDFTSPSTISEINTWIEKETQGLIDNALDELLPDTKICGINTLYFNGKWRSAFDKAKTEPTVFTNLSGKKVKVDMMAQAGSFPYMKTESFQLLSLPYDKRESKNAIMQDFSLYIFLPLPEKGFAPIMDYLKNNDLITIRNEMTEYCNQSSSMVQVRLPRFETSTDINVMAILKTLGIKTCFGPNADFGNISDDGVYINDSRQKAIIRVDEEGTVAAAMTDAMLVKAEAPPSQEAYFYADHPFLYMIVCENLNTILFIGQYTEGKIEKEGQWITDENISKALRLSFREDVDCDADKDSDKAYDVCDKMPSFPNGVDAYNNYIKTNLKYPKAALDNKIQGRVVIEVIVEKDGTLSNHKIIKSAHPALDKEALRLVKSMPKFTPAEQNGKNVRVKYLLPINFKKP